jgi:predicted alpha/beta-hydrolase family hydrolase
MDSAKIVVPVPGAASVTALLYPASKSNRANATLILGHGAGANQLSGFMRMVAAGLSERGLDVVTFNFLYMEQGRKVPDPKPRLEGCYRAVIDAVLKHRSLKKNRLVIGGKSMGGRIGSQVAAIDGENISGLVFLGYPLHPPGRPDKLRAEHFKDIAAPLLFVQGSRDAFGTPDEIREALKMSSTDRRPVDKSDKLAACRTTFYVIESGDHSFKVPKSARVPQQEVYEKVMDEIAEWVRGLPGADKRQKSLGNVRSNSF